MLVLESQGRRLTLVVVGGGGGWGDVECRVFISPAQSKNNDVHLHLQCYPLKKSSQKWVWQIKIPHHFQGCKFVTVSWHLFRRIEGCPYSCLPPSLLVVQGNKGLYRPLSPTLSTCCPGKERAVPALVSLPLYLLSREIKGCTSPCLPPSLLVVQGNKGLYRPLSPSLFTCCPGE